MTLTTKQSWLLAGLLIATAYLILPGCSAIPKDQLGSNHEFFNQKARWGH